MFDRFHALVESLLPHGAKLIGVTEKDGARYVVAELSDGTNVTYKTEYAPCSPVNGRLVLKEVSGGGLL